MASMKRGKENKEGPLVVGGISVHKPLPHIRCIILRDLVTAKLASVKMLGRHFYASSDASAILKSCR